jgi:inorganic pyrophosphatase
MDIDKITIGEDPPRDINVLIEIPQGGVPVKYELDKDSGVLRVDRFLHTAMYYPGNYGFVPHTLSETRQVPTRRSSRCLPTSCTPSTRA